MQHLPGRTVVNSADLVVRSCILGTALERVILCSKIRRRYTRNRIRSIDQRVECTEKVLIYAITRVKTHFSDRKVSLCTRQT